MRLQVDAVYENGVLRPLQPLDLSEHERIIVSVIKNSPPSSRSSMAVESGVMPWCSCQITMSCTLTRWPAMRALPPQVPGVFTIRSLDVPSIGDCL